MSGGAGAPSTAPSRSLRRTRSLGAGAAQQRLTDATLERLALARLLLVGPVPGRFGLLFRSTLVLHDLYPIMPEGRMRHQAITAPRVDGYRRNDRSRRERSAGRYERLRPATVSLVASLVAGVAAVAVGRLLG
jgi:hypothetical protein